LRTTRLGLSESLTVERDHNFVAIKPALEYFFDLVTRQECRNILKPSQLLYQRQTLFFTGLAWQQYLVEL